MTMWLASLVVRENHTLQPLMAAKPIARIGRISYGMYMYHTWVFVIIASINRFLQARWGFAIPLPLFVTRTFITILIAELSYRFYETPFLKWKVYFSSQLK
jgi:peptidoglycan/LPS O-acetylase OafA/YrhL